MSRKSRREAVTSGVSEVTDALQSAGASVADTVGKTSRRARKRATSLAAKAVDSLPASVKPAKAKPKRRKRKMAVLVVLLAGAGFAAKKLKGGSPSGPRTPDE